MLQDEVEDGMVGVDLSAEEGWRMNWRAKEWKKWFKDEIKVPFSPMHEELYVPKQLRKGDCCYKWMAKLLYGILY